MRQGVRGGGPPRAVQVGVGLDLLLGEVLEYRCEDAPGGIELGGGDKVGVVGGERLEQQALVRLGHRLRVVVELVGVEQVHAHLLHLKLEPGHLVDHLPVDGLLGLEPDDELVGRAVLERGDHARHLVELDPHLRLAVGQRLARLEHKGHAVPPGCVHVQHGRGKRLRGAVLVLDGGVLEVARMLAAAHVLARHQVVARQRQAGLEDLELLAHDVLRCEGEGLLHRHQRHHLQQVVLHDVADDAVLVKVAAAPLAAKVLLEDHLHRLDRLPVPDG